MNYKAILVGILMLVLGAILGRQIKPHGHNGSIHLPVDQDRTAWGMVWSNTVPVPIAIARVVSNRLETLPVDYQQHPMFRLTITSETLKAESDPFDKTKFRVMTDGTRWKVQEDRGYGWMDDVFGGYFTTESAARQRIAERRKFWMETDRDAATQKNFKEVK